MATQQSEILTPVGRLVMGSLYKPQTTDAEGKPLLVKNGPNAGQPTQRFFFALAIPKDGQHWATTKWGAVIWAAGHAAFPNGAAQGPAFAWKVVDGDSIVPNTKGTKPADREGYPGHWVLSFSSGFAPKIYRLDAAGAAQPWVEPDAVNMGDYVEVLGTVAGNGSPLKPGMFLNHNMVCFRGFGARISSGPDASGVGFGAAALPAGASTMPVGAAMAPTPPVPGVPGVPAAPAVVAPPVVVPPSTTFMAPPVGVPAVPVVPQVPVAPVVVPLRQLTPKAMGCTYEQLLSQGWTDDLLLTNGLMVMV